MPALNDRLRTIELATVVVTTGVVVNSDKVTLPAARNAWIFAAKITVSGAANDHDEVAVQTSMDGTIWTDLCTFTSIGDTLNEVGFSKVLAVLAETQRTDGSSVAAGQEMNMAMTFVRLHVDSAADSEGTVELSVCAI